MNAHKAAPSFLHGLVSLLPHKRDYYRLGRTWKADLVAGVTVGVVALPLALGFGVSSGLSAEAGLITAIVAGMIAAIFGGSHVQVSGPTGAMVVVLLPIVAQHGAAAVTTVSVMAGLIVLAAGALRLGKAVAIIPWPVIEGFTLGIAAIIFLQQIPLLVSPHVASATDHSSNALVAAFQSLDGVDSSYIGWALGVAAVVMACMAVAPRIHPKIPGSILGIVVATLLCAVVSNPLSQIGALPHSLPAPSMPDFSLPLVTSLIGPALTVAALAAIESLLSARVASGLGNTGSFDPDRELVGQGLASVGSGLFGGMPATGAIARTAVNVKAGGRTRVSGIVHALVLLLVVLAASGPVSRIPLAALAGVLMFTAVRMISRVTVLRILRSTRGDAMALILTAIVTLAFDLILAVMIGIAFAGINALRNASRGAVVRREELSELGFASTGGVSVVRFEGPLIFASAERVFTEATMEHGADVIILRLSGIGQMDVSGAHALTDAIRELENRGMTVLVKGIRPHHERLLRSVGLMENLRHPMHLYASLEPAIAHAYEHLNAEATSLVCDRG